MKKIIVKECMALKLFNILENTELFVKDRIDLQIEQMQNYIKSRGGCQVGPLIQYNQIIVDDGISFSSSNFLFQSSIFCESLDSPYNMKKSFYIPNCLYCRYIGPQETIKFAYDKLNLYAFENDIPLKGDSYTIFVD